MTAPAQFCTVIGMHKIVGSLALVCLAACGGDSEPTAAEADAGKGLPSCASTCPGVLGAMCSHGPVSQQDCVDGCESVRASACLPEYRALFSCGGATPVYACDAAGQVILKGCNAEGALLYACLAKQ
jgi:hypothetical protein